MKFISLIILLMGMCGGVVAQKKVIDPTVYQRWPSVGGNPKLSENGKYVIYILENVPAGKQTTVVQATDGKWKTAYVGGLKNAQFTNDGRSLLFISEKDSLIRLTLGTGTKKYMGNTSFFRLDGHKDGEWLSYQQSGKSDTLVLLDLKTKQKRFFMDVDYWQFSPNGEALLLQKVIDKRSNLQSLYWVNPWKAGSVKIWQGTNPENIVLDDLHPQLAFKSDEAIFYYKPGLDHAELISTENVRGIKSTHAFGDIRNFSKDGKGLFIKLKEKRIPEPLVQEVEIWSYADTALYAEQVSESGTREYLARLNLISYQIIQIQDKFDWEPDFPKDIASSDSIALMRNSPPRSNPWSIKDKISWKLVSTKNGRLKKLDFLNDKLVANLSPMGRYIIYFCPKEQGFYSYEIASGKLRSLTSGITTTWTDLNRDDLLTDTLKGYARGELIWLKDESAFLACDRYDIWRLDPLGKQKPLNLTNGYGKAHQLVFNFALKNYVDGLSEATVIYLNAFNTESKKNGFFSKKISVSGDPKLLSMGAYIFKTNSVYVPAFSDFTPIKAKSAAMYLVRRMSATNAPNYYSTKDFRSFVHLSDLYPERAYNWYTTELHTWRSPSGKMLKGVLYKPENFNPGKQYPLIFHHYERKSDALNAYIKPEPLCDYCSINIPSYVSQGYLVFCPDIYFSIGDPMQGTYDALVSAAKYVTAFPFVDPKKLGIQGCSFGALQTNYVVSQTDIFAAAVSVSGISDLVSHYGSIQGGDKSSLQSYYEGGQARMGASFWEIPGAYIKNSPIFHLNKISTPLLLMHTKKDGIYPFANILEFFTGLRRLGKKVWMLVYPQGNHGLLGKEAGDFSIRMMQFFNYYLKKEPAPLWMLEGMSSSEKGSVRSLLLDVNHGAPLPGILTPEEQRKADSLTIRKPISLLLK